mgnify:FL=1
MYSHQDLLELLNKQRNLYEKDIKHWQSALESSTSMIQEVGTFILDISTKLYSTPLFCLEYTVILNGLSWPKTISQIMKINNNFGSWEIKSDKSNLSWNPNEDLNIKDQWWGDATHWHSWKFNAFYVIHAHIYAKGLLKSNWYSSLLFQWSDNSGYQADDNVVLHFTFYAI